MNIGEAARQSGLPTKTIRYYESIGLLSPSRRTNGFRDYGEGEVHNLRFIGCARGLGFSVDQCRDLVDLFADRTRAAADLRAAAQPHLVTIERKVEELRRLKRTLDRLMGEPIVEGRPIWPVLEAPCEDIGE